MRHCVWLGLLALSASFAPAAGAEVTMTDLQVAARALSFLDDPLTGRVRVGLVYAPASPRSTRQAEQLRSQIGSGLRVGNIVLVPVLVELDEAGSADVDMFLLTEYVPAGGRQLASAGKARRIPCVTTDVEQVRGGACLMAVRSTPRVEILVNREVAGESGLTFATAFRVMITEI